MARAYLLSIGTAFVMAIQSAAGLLFQEQYRDVAWIKATWFGNDWITLAVGVPLLVAGLSGAARGSLRGLLVWLGMLWYAVYNNAFYLFGGALNAFFPLYVLAVVMASAALVLATRQMEIDRVAASFRHGAPVRLIGGSLVFIAAGLATVWIATWAAYVVAGRPTPIEPEAFKVVAALDLTMMVPALAIGGVLLWQRRPWGFALAATASIQSTLYLLVLSLNSFIAIRRGLTASPGELPLWGTLMVVTGAAALGLVMNVCAERPSRDR